MPILEISKETGWFWDTEVMTRAYYAGLKIKEIPAVLIRNSKATTVNFIPDILKYLYSLFKFIPENYRLRNAWKVNRKK